MKTYISILFVICSVLLFQNKGFSQSCLSSVAAPNLVTNGDFENTGIVNASYGDYSYVSGSTGATGPDSWGITDPVSHRSSYVPATWKGNAADADGDPTGHYMLIDADNVKKNAWKAQSIAVTAGTTYFFSAWIANINENLENPSKLHFGYMVPPSTTVTVISATDILANSLDHEWSQYYTAWTPTSNQTITLVLENENGTSDGNDMALDNISFSTSCKFVQQLRTSTLPEKFNVCDASTVTLNSAVPTANTTFNWYKNGTATGTNSPSLTGATSVSGPNTYILCYTNSSNGCSQTDTTVVLNAPIAITVNPISPTTCGGNGSVEVVGLVPGGSYTLKYNHPTLNTLNGQVANAQGKLIISGAAGSYTSINVTNAYSCNSNSLSASISDPAPPVIVLNGTITPKSTCNATWSSIRLYGNAPTNPLQSGYDYLVTVNGTTTTMTTASTSTPYLNWSSTPAGHYTYQIKDPATNCSSNIIPLDLINDDEPTITATAACTGGVITITISGASPNTDYIIGDGPKYQLNGVDQTKVQNQTSNASGVITWTQNAAGNPLPFGAYTNITIGLTSSCSSNAVDITQSCVLPVKLMSFTGTKKDNLNALAWTTSSEENNDHFIIERSSNGTDFSPIGKVDGEGNSNTMTSYHFNDVHPLNGINYYRLKQVDYNGSSSYSNTVALDNKKAGIDIYPNPSNGAFTINLPAGEQSYKLDITDMAGKMVYSNLGDAIPASIEVSDLPKGVYTVTFQLDDNTSIKKLVVY